MTDHARVVIIGGGAVGCSTLYHLAKMGWTDCLLLEMNELTSGSTWHAAGNVPNFSTSWNIIKAQRHSSKLYARLGDEVGYPINYHITGSIRLANNKERMDEYRHVAAMARAQGIEFEVISSNEVKDKYPFIELHDVMGALYDPYDGDIDPSQLVQAYAKGAKDLGCRIQRFTRVTALERAGKEWLVKTDKGDVRCEIVVNAAGYRAGEIMAMVGQYMPIVSMSHQYLVTEMVPELTARKEKLPLLRDPDVSYYLRQERDGLLLGPYEWQATPHWLDGIPDDFAYQLWPDALDRLETYIEKAIERVPLLGTVGVQRVINGPIPYSPDGNPYIGPAHGLPNFYQACCFSFGISQSGGAGKTAAEWIAHGEPEWDFWSLDPRRYTDYATKSYVVEKAVELYQNEYAIAFPANEWPAGPPRQDHGALRQAEGQGRVVLRARRLGARGLVPAQGRRCLAQAQLPPHQLARGGGGGMQGGARARRHPRPRRLHQAGDRGQGRQRLAGRHDLRQAAEAEPHEPQLHAERQGRHRQRVHHHAAGRRQVLPDVGGRRRMARSRLAREAYAEGRRNPDRQPVGALWLDHHRRAEIARGAGQGHRGRSLQQGVPVAVGQADRDRLCPHAGDARQLCRRAGLGIARAHGADGADL